MLHGTLNPNPRKGDMVAESVFLLVFRMLHGTLTLNLKSRKGKILLQGRFSTTLIYPISENANLVSLPFVSFSGN